MEYQLDGKTYKDKEFISGYHDVFVFGSNLAGVHGAGAARYAYKHFGALLHQGWGPQGNSFAIPTKDAELLTLPLKTIAGWVNEFLEYARSRPDLKFFITRIGCGLAGYKDTEVRPLFKNAPDNCDLPEGWVT